MTPPTATSTHHSTHIHSCFSISFSLQSHFPPLPHPSLFSHSLRCRHWLSKRITRPRSSWDVGISATQRRPQEEGVTEKRRSLLHIKYHRTPNLLHLLRAVMRLPSLLLPCFIGTLKTSLPFPFGWRETGGVINTSRQRLPLPLLPSPRKMGRIDPNRCQECESFSSASLCSSSPHLPSSR